MGFGSNDVIDSEAGQAADCSPFSPVDHILQIADSNNSSKKREQGRKGSSCTLCRRGKRKCDGEKPCRRCMIRGSDIAAACAAEGKGSYKRQCTETKSESVAVPFAEAIKTPASSVAKESVLNLAPQRPPLVQGELNNLSAIQMALQLLQNSQFYRPGAIANSPLIGLQPAQQKTGVDSAAPSLSMPSMLPGQPWFNSSLLPLSNLNNMTLPSKNEVRASTLEVGSYKHPFLQKAPLTQDAAALPYQNCH
mmetsp:Transcript_129685/g.193038  ORF Transcript_129685/g.193038 Transcript_129685/m.193038 type:complete len:250 (+) Transcript_129685:130-879(+)